MAANSVITAKFVASTCETDPISLPVHFYGVIQIPPVWTTAQLGFKVGPSRDSTFIPVFDNTTRVTIPNPIASRAYALPAQLTGATHVRLHSVSASGADIDQVAESIVHVHLKG